ncbi:MAG: hypothetical protein KKB21_03775, partial [Nanoarchaeota archaeon]|nr:hypothetical protein [Nanoarchaeota archaeon]
MTNQEYKLTDSFELQSQVRTGNSNSDTIRVIHKPIKSADSLVIVLHGYTMKKECLLYIGDFLNSIGISTAHIDLPLHGERAFDGAEHCYPRDVSPEKIKRGIEQIYSEVNQLSSLFRSRYHSIGLFGFSLGAISTMLCMGRGRQIDKGVAICGGGNLADIILTSPITWDLAQELRNQKVGYKTLRKALKQV